MRVSAAGSFIALLLPAFAPAQEGRYELGRRVIEFEKEFEEHLDDPAVRKRTVGPLNEAVKSFFSFNVAKTAQSLTEAGFAIKNEKPTPEQLWAASLQFLPESRLVDKELIDLKVTVRPFYDAKVKVPDEVTLRLQWESGRWGNKRDTFQSKTEIPGSFRIPIRDEVAPAHRQLWNEPDRSLSVAVDKSDTPLRHLHLSATLSPNKSLPIGKSVTEANKKAGNRSLEAKTAEHLIELLQSLYRGEILETDYPAGRLTEELLRLIIPTGEKKEYYGPSHPGQFWLAVPTAKSSSVVRLLVPEKLTEENKVPLVVALHGMGGSKKMFFDACGAGCCVRNAGNAVG